MKQQCPKCGNWVVGKEKEDFAEQGNAAAQYNLGVMYEEGQGVHQISNRILLLLCMS